MRQKIGRRTWTSAKERYDLEMCVSVGTTVFAKHTVHIALSQKAPQHPAASKTQTVYISCIKSIATGPSIRTSSVTPLSGQGYGGRGSLLGPCVSAAQSHSAR